MSCFSTHGVCWHSVICKHDHAVPDHVMHTWTPESWSWIGMYMYLSVLGRVHCRVSWRHDDVRECRWRRERCVTGTSWFRNDCERHCSPRLAANWQRRQTVPPDRTSPLISSAMQSPSRLPYTAVSRNPAVGPASRRSNPTLCDRLLSLSTERPSRKFSCFSSTNVFTRSISSSQCLQRDVTGFFSWISFFSLSRPLNHILHLVRRRRKTAVYGVELRTTHGIRCLTAIRIIYKKAVLCSSCSLQFKVRRHSLYKLRVEASEL